MTEQTDSRHWHLEIDGDNIGWLSLDKQDSSTNVLSASVLQELHIRLTALASQSLMGLVIQSAKSNGFIAGADISEFTQIKDRAEALKMIRFGQETFDRLEALPFPTVALINGFCVGGGLELALACRYRIALEDPRTRLGLPEVMLGIHPGFGGSVRLIRLIGVPTAMDLMLSGRTVDARAAAKLGIIDRAVPERHLQTAARACMKSPPKPHAPGLVRYANLGPVRSLLAGYLRKQVAKRADPAHYPAPYALINVWEQHGGDAKQMLVAEAESVAQLITTDTARNLVRVFFLKERMKGLGRAKDFKPKRVHVIGAGTMGGDIAAWCALQGFEVTLQDREPKYIAPAMKRAADLFNKRIKDRTLRRAAFDRLVADHQGLGVPTADVIIEAIIEKLEAKQALFRDIEPRMKPDAILATNTSSIPLETLNASLTRPERLIGVHFFNPVAQMQLVEIIAAPNTDQAFLSKGAAFVRAIDRLPLPVKSSPGFLVNRVLMPYLLEAVTIHQQGTPAVQIDQAARAFGMPMGPLELADTVGLDICLHVGDILAQHLGKSVPEQLRSLVQQGHLGRKSGSGFYQYQKGKPKKRGEATRDAGVLKPLADRMVQKLLDEANACLREGVVEDADLVDAGMIFGTGFAPFRGGPLHYAATLKPGS
jgi:3-hydroxyacyl-CoA dehydrogenase/enoyl-CoA hydratase/3-hydroxybutyryl-CoA epimerase